MGVFHRPLYATAHSTVRPLRAYPITLFFSLLILICYIAISYSGWVWHFTHRCELSTRIHPWAAIDPPLHPPSLVIASIIDNFLPQTVRQASIRNKRQYAAQWNYSVIIPSHTALHNLPPQNLPVAWKKFALAQQLLTRFEFVLMVDADAVFMRNDIGWHPATSLLQQRNHSLLISDDLNGPNSGIFLLRRSKWTSDFLNDALQSANQLSRPNRFIPLKYENRAFLYLLNRWPRCFGMHRIDALKAPVHPMYRERRRYVTTVPRCWINRHPKRATRVVEFFDAGAGFDDVDDAFIAHAAGGDVDGKAQTLRELFDVAEKRMGSQHRPGEDSDDDVDDQWLR